MITSLIKKSTKIAKSHTLRFKTTHRSLHTTRLTLFSLDPLPYPKNALAPYISEETLEYHHGKHHAAYVNKLNELTKGTDLESKSLSYIVKTQKGAIFNNAAQAWNHKFYWNSLSPNGGGEPKGKLGDMINKKFGSFKEFQKEFDKEAVSHFGSGWVWLVIDSNSELKIISTHDAGNPIVDGLKPLLTCDVWEHAYYIDYRNQRPKYMENFWNLVNWEFAEKNLNASEHIDY